MWWALAALAALAVTGARNARRDRVSYAGTEGGFTTRVMKYRSRDGSRLFRFRFAAVPGDVRVYILEFPNPLIGPCHILRDNYGPYVCWSQAVHSLRAAQAVAAMWAEATLMYQRTGRTF